MESILKNPFTEDIDDHTSNLLKMILTERQLHVLKMYMQGLTVSEMAVNSQLRVGPLIQTLHTIAIRLGIIPRWAMVDIIDRLVFMRYIFMYKESNSPVKNPGTFSAIRRYFALEVGKKFWTLFPEGSNLDAYAYYKKISPPKDVIPYDKWIELLTFYKVRDPKEKKITVNRIKGEPDFKPSRYYREQFTCPSSDLPSVLDKPASASQG